jgi:hypothetical protein
MRFIRIQGDDFLVFTRTEAEMRIYIRFKIRLNGIDAIRNEVKIHLVDVPADSQTMFDLLNGKTVMGTEIGEYYITPRGAVKRDHDAPA